jgi:hypothetical protein
MDPFDSLVTSGLEDACDWVVHQAEGIIAVQAAVSVSEAGLRLDEYSGDM